LGYESARAIPKSIEHLSGRKGANVTKKGRIVLNN